MTKQSRLNLEEIIELNKNGYNLKEIADYYSICYQGVQKFLKVRNSELPIKWPKNKEVNHSFFSNIDSEIKAYLLGFFIADGCVYDNARIGICVSETDQYIIDLFKDHIHPTANIKKFHSIKGAINRKPQVMIRISSIQIVQDLAKFKIGQRKTFSNIEVPNINENLIPHLIRGFFDGDGCMCISSSKGRPNYNLSFSNGTPCFLKSIQKFLPTKKSYLSKRKDTVFVLEIRSKSEILAIKDYFYKEANYYFKRKKDKFDSII